MIEESEDESLMDRYLGGDPVDEDLLVKDLETAVAGARLIPCWPCVAPTAAGVQSFWICARSAVFPSPAEHPARRSPSARAVPVPAR